MQQQRDVWQEGRSVARAYLARGKSDISPVRAYKDESDLQERGTAESGHSWKILCWEDPGKKILLEKRPQNERGL